MNSPFVTQALDKDAIGTTSGRSWICVAANPFVDIVDNVAGYFSLSRASVAINPGVRRAALVGEKTIFAPLMILNDIIANNGANAFL